MKEALPFMHAAIEQARKGATPFGCVIVKNDTIVAGAYSTVHQEHDVTAHAEINAIRKLHSMKKRSDFSGYTLYTTTEPCPMCTSACLYAGITTIVYGASITQFKRYAPVIDIASHEIVAKSNHKVLIIPGMLAPECLDLFEEYQA